MDRPIKFRGKRIDNGRWVFGYLEFIYVDNKEKACIYDPIAVQRYDVYTNTVGQYIGINDKKGTEIYEDDIVAEKLPCGDIQLYSVKYRESEFTLRPDKTDIYNWKSWPMLSDGTLSILEVVGNTHDNPNWEIAKYERKKEINNERL
jgi:uncharacterized phage protein (TIGR01671 family)